MKTLFSQQFGLSASDEPERRRHIRYLTAFLFGTTILTGIVVVLNLEGFTASPIPIRLTAVFLVINVLAWSLLRKNRLDAGAFILIGGYWLIITLTIADSGGLDSPWLLGQLAITILGGVFASGWGGVVLAVLSIATDFVIYRLLIAGLITPSNPQPQLFDHWLSILISFMLVGIITLLARQFTRDNLERARTGEKRYRALFEKTNDAIFIIGMNQNYLNVNQQAADLLGYTVDELIGMPVARVVVPEERSVAQEKLKLLAEKGVLPVYERTVVCKDGSRKTVQVNLALVTDEQGRPLHYQSIVRDVSEQKRLEQQLKDSLLEMENVAMRDSLTGMLNRRAITDYAEGEWHRSRREAKPMCLVLIDVDNLKAINDSLGHLAGDEALVKLAQAINVSKRRYDWTGRWGGDEFLMVLPATNLVEAQEVAERLRQLFAETDFVLGDKNGLNLQVSLGIACFTGRPGDDTSLDKVLAQADQALYLAKESGRDQVGVYRD